MKKVLVPLAVDADNKGQITYIIRPTYLAALEKARLEPVLVSCEISDVELRQAYDNCGGVMMVGGWDVDPKYYGQESHQMTRVVGPKRDDLELLILSWLKTDKKPFLGICRGEQILNVAFGGSLIQHLSDLVTEQHTVGKYDNLGEATHEIQVDGDSRLAGIIGTRVVVNTGHHQAIDKVGAGLRIVARTKQGVVEAIEGVDRSHFVLGVQWHPEADKSETSDKIFAAFAGNIR